MYLNIQIVVKTGGGMMVEMLALLRFSRKVCHVAKPSESSEPQVKVKSGSLL